MPELSTQMIEVGEESGNLDEMLEKVAEFYEEEINFLIDQITALVEPVFIVVIGTIVGFIVLAMYLPIFRMAKVVTGGAGASPGGI
jgi:type IV pilus assembly protein PilC